jgi:hypothetical protein
VAAACEAVEATGQCLKAVSRVLLEGARTDVGCMAAGRPQCAADITICLRPGSHSVMQLCACTQHLLHSWGACAAANAASSQQPALMCTGNEAPCCLLPAGPPLLPSEALDGWESTLFHCGSLRRLLEDLGAALYPPQEEQELGSAAAALLNCVEVMMDECPEVRHARCLLSHWQHAAC